MKDEAFAGAGTAEEPYKIEYVEDLIVLAKSVNSGNGYKDNYFILVSKLDFADSASYKDATTKMYGDINKDGKVDELLTELTTGQGFETIGSKKDKSGNDCTFLGTFIGDDKTIKNYNVTLNSLSESELSQQDKLIGLFGRNGGTISNLKVVGNININSVLEGEHSSTVKVGMICAENSGTIDSCKTEGEINVTLQNIVTKTAGVVGVNTGKIINSSNSANITSNQEKAGITAESASKGGTTGTPTGNISNDQNSKTSTGSTSNGEDARTSIGSTSNGEGRETSAGNTLESDYTEITNCTNTGKIIETTGSDFYTAGIVANNKETTITSCTNNGRVEGKMAGGIAGISTGRIVACQNTAIVSNLNEKSDNTEVAGGIAGILENNTMENCKNTGDISGLTNVGGLVGKNKGDITVARNDGIISKNSESVAGRAYIGGIAGSNLTKASITNSKNYGNISSEADNLVALGGICGIMYTGSAIETSENHGNLSGIAKIITPNEDLNNNCKDCSNFGGGAAQNFESGELHLGLIYGKFEEVQ